MSSPNAKHALFLALGGFSIATIFVWYQWLHKKGKKSEKVRDLVANGIAKKAIVENGVHKAQNGHAGGQSQQSEHEDAEETIPVIVENEEKTNEKELIPVEEDDEETVVEVSTEEEEEEEDVNAAAGDSGVVDEEHDESTENQFQEINILPSNPPQKEVEIEKAAEPEVEEQFVKKEEIKLKSAPVPLITMPSKKKVLEHEQIPEEPTPTKVLDTPLSLDITAQMSPAAFSWSEEMENSYNEENYRMNESSDIDRSPASPIRHIPNNNKKGQGNGNAQQRNNRKGGRGNGMKESPHHQERHAPVKKGQRRLVVVREKEKIVEEPPKQVQHQQFQQQEKPQQKRNNVVNHQPHESGDVVREKKVEVQQQPVEEDRNSNSPGVDSQNSEASSQDSGRATGGQASSLSPGAELLGGDDEFQPIYEFEIPNSLVGLIIGVKGKTIKELSMRTDVRMLIRQHHETDKTKTHQICQVRGKREKINHCLQVLRRRFQPSRFPELNLQPVVPPAMPSNNFDMLSTQPTWLTLPDEIKCEVAVCSIISPSHFFVHQPTHPSFASLRHLDMYMGTLYGEHSNLPELPIPCENGLLCAASVGNAWFRAVTVKYEEDTDEVFVKFVDHGGYTKMARQDLRQIRTDLMSLPFQSTEVMLAHVRPVDGTLNWSDAAWMRFRELCTGRIINTKVVGWSVESRIPMVELYVTMNNYEVRFDQVLMEEGLARTADPSKMSRTSYAQNITAKRPSLASQTSQTTVVC